MLSEKEIRELIDYMTQPNNKLHDKQFTWELNLLQRVLNGDSEAVAKPLLGEGWRDARKELPPLYTRVLCYSKTGGVYFGERLKHYWETGDGRERPDYWMPLPDPPAFT